MQVPIISGIYTDAGNDFRTAYPVNLVPVPKDTGINQGYLRPADGIDLFGPAGSVETPNPGIGRGGIVWDGVHYRVMGQKLVRVSDTGAMTELGTISGTDRVRFAYSFDRLAIAANGRLWYYNAGGLVRVTDPDLGRVYDVLWVDGYFMTTDGESLVVTELADPTAVNPLKYGSSEANPDGVVALRKIRREVYALNRYTVEAFSNVGGSGFPYQAIPGAQIERGCVGKHAAAVVDDALVFVGSAPNEPPAVYMAANGQSAKLSNREIDTMLAGLTDAQLAGLLVETQQDKAHQLIIIHLPDRAVVYDIAASKAMQQPVWHVRSSAVHGFGQYRLQNLTYSAGRWVGDDPQAARMGALTADTSEHYGQPVGWEFGVRALYNEGRSGIIHAVELVALTGQTPLGVDPTVWTSYSHDGQTWGQERSVSAGKQGDRAKRLQWRSQGQVRNWRVQRFRGTSDTRLSPIRLEITVEALNV